MAAMFKRKDQKPAPVVAGEAKMAFGEISTEQRDAALKAAATARAEKKLLLDRIRAGEITLAEMLGDAYKHDERIQRLLVGSALRALPKPMTQYRATKILDEVGISKGRRIQGLGSRQKEKLLELAG